MSKIRVYELAKETGMDSKTLTAKLKDLGYEVKAYNSAIEEEVVDEIRKKLGVLTTQVERKIIQSKGRPTIIRRRTRSVPLEEDVVDAKEDEDLPVEEEIVEEDIAVGDSTSIAGEPEVMAEVKTCEVVAEPPASQAVEAEDQGAEIEKVEVADQEMDAGISPVVEQPVQTAPESLSEDIQSQSAVVEAPKPPKVDKSRKGFARVIKKAAIVIVPEEEVRPKAKKIVRPKARTVESPVVGVAEVIPDLDAKDAAAKGKKGKRFVKFHTEPVAKERLPKRTAGRRDGLLDVEPDEVDLFDGRIPAGIRIGRIKRGGGKKHKQAVVQEVAEAKAIKRRIKVHEIISVADLAHRMGVRSNEVIAKLMSLGVMATVNQALDVESATLVASEFGYEVEQAMTGEQSVIDLEEQASGGEEILRPPVVTVMGHVDHGKTSILDAIRKTDVAAGEAGGITQHIGAHYVRSAKGDVVFLDTPGHAAFTEMRSRGAKVTDVVVLVVAADDGVMGQTREAINHAKAAEVQIVVAINKIDKPEANPERVKRELSEFGLVPEEWGGQTIYCEVSAKKNIGIEALLEQILLQAEILELKADPKRRARGRVIEAQLHKGRGPVATILVQQGTLRVGDAFVVGNFFGRVRSLANDKGENIKEGGPSMPVEVQGLSGVPQAGDEFVVVPDEKLARTVSAQRHLKSREKELAVTSKISLDNLFEKLQEGKVKELRVLLRADVQGTLEAFGKAMEQLSTEEIKVKILHDGTGTITESDVLLAAASEALIIGFNVRPTVKIQDLAKAEKVDIRTYDVIYHALDDIKKAMVGMLDPTFSEKVIGSVEVRTTFQVPKVGTIAGCYVLNGKIERNAKVRVVRDGVVVYTGRILSLRRFKDDAREVLTGYECGVGIENFNDLKLGDILEIFTMEEVAREL